MSDFLLKRADGSSRKVFGYQYTAPQAGSKTYQSDRYDEDKLPKKIDLREYMTKVEDQGQVGSCTANAVAGAYEFLVKRHQGVEDYDVSRLFIYYNARKKAGQENQDKGSAISYAIDSLKVIGACSEATWPYDKDAVFDEPSEEAYEEAAQFLVDDTELIPTDLHAWKHALAEGYPIIFGIALFDSFDKQKKKGVVPAPTKNEASRGSHAAHAMLCVGYSDVDKVFIVRNSWGERWGDKGYCYMPFDYVINPKYNLSDSWIIRQVEPVPEAEELWDDSEESLLTEIESEFANMDDDLFSEMLDEMGDYSVETRLAIIMLTASMMDGNLDDSEVEGIAEYLATILDSLGIDLDAYAVLENSMEYVGDEDLLKESVDLLGKYLSAGALASIALHISEIAGADGLKSKEQEFILELISCWQFAENQNAQASYTPDDEEDEDEEDEEDE